MKEFTKTIVNGLMAYIKKARSNWNQNDETAIDYVRNRTHWSEIGLVEILPETTVSTDEYVKFTNSIILEVGKTYNVVFNGTEYECVAWSNGDAVLIGNGSIYGGNDVSTGNIGGNGEPFSCDNYDDGAIYLNVSEYGAYTIKISSQSEIIHKLDMKYLPEMQNKNILNGSAEGSIRTVGANTKIGKWAFAEGNNTKASGYASHAEGIETYAEGESAHAEGDRTIASGNYSHAEGYCTTASGEFSHAEGWYTTAGGNYSHAEGYNTTASGEFSHAEGWYTTASGTKSHAEGDEAIASGYASHAEGANTKASGEYQHVQGKYNIEDTEDKYAHIVGNGEYSDDGSLNSNAHTLDWNGNAWFKGDVYINSTSGKNKDEGSKKLATEEYVDEQLNSASSSSKLISHVLPIEATEENQTIFPINLETFDAANDTVLVQDGITLLLPNSGFTIENNTIVMTTPWGLGDTGSILILKNTPVLVDEVAISGAVIENNSITLDKLSADITTELDEIKKSASDGKALVAGAITDKGIETATDATFEQIATNIGSIVTLENGTDDATVTSDKMLKDVTAYAKGVKVTGSIESLTAATITPGTSAKTIAAGKYLEGTQTIAGDANLVAANIAKGKSIFGVTGTYDPLTGSNLNDFTLTGGALLDTASATYIRIAHTSENPPPLSILYWFSDTASNLSVMVVFDHVNMKYQILQTSTKSTAYCYMYDESNSEMSASGSFEHETTYRLSTGSNSAYNLEFSIDYNSNYYGVQSSLDISDISGECAWYAFVKN